GKVTQNPLTGFRKSGTGDLLDGAARNGVWIGRCASWAGGHPDTVVVRQVQGRNGETAGSAGTRTGPGPGTEGGGDRCRGPGRCRRPRSGPGGRGGFRGRPGRRPGPPPRPAPPPGPQPAAAPRGPAHTVHTP